jgi:hypothetical protein
MEGCFAAHIPSSPLYNAPYNAGTEEDYEASASSMAEEGLEDEEDDENDEDDDKRERDKRNHASPQPLGVIYNKSKVIGNHKHRRMSSGNSSTDSTANMPPIAKSNKLDKKHKFATYQQRSNMTFPFQNHYLLSRKRLEPGYGPTSGYDGDTESPLIEDKQR